VCDVIDINRFNLAKDNSGNIVTLENDNGIDGVVEYATGYVGNGGSYPFDLTQDNSDIVINECNDPNVVWTTDYESLGIENITKVRFRATAPLGGWVRLSILHLCHIGLI